MSVQWDYYDKFEDITDMYLPISGEGNTKATQIVTAVNKLVYKYYNDGDVFDNTHYLVGGANDLSSYANWLYYQTTDKAENILDKIVECYNDDDYEDLLKELADELLNEEFLTKQNKIEKMKTIYNCNGKFEYKEEEDEEYY
jgi:thiaminase